MYACLSLLASLLLSSCGEVGDAPSRHFVAREEVSFAAEGAPDALEVTVANEIPVVPVPEPHVATHVHLNVELCGALPDGPLRQVVATREQAESYVERPSQRCIALSPTVYAKTSATYHVPAATYAALLGGDYTALAVRFQSSTQTTAHHYVCRGRHGKLTPSFGGEMRLAVTVDGQHSTSFNCR